MLLGCSFVTIHPAESSTWDVKWATLSQPSIEDPYNNIRVVFAEFGHFEDRTAAQTYATRLAEKNNRLLIIDSMRVATVAHICDTFRPVELTSSGDVIERGKPFQHIKLAIIAAQVLADNKDVFFVLQGQRVGVSSLPPDN
jgi:hypothetical protein